MNDTLMSLTRSLFQNAEMQRVADLAYGQLLNGRSDALRMLSGYLVSRGMVVIIRGHEVRARAAGSRSVAPPQIIFDLHGGSSGGAGAIAVAYQSNTNCKSYYLDGTATADLMEMEDRYADGVARGSEGSPDRGVSQNTVLRV